MVKPLRYLFIAVLLLSVGTVMMTACGKQAEPESQAVPTNGDSVSSADGVMIHYEAHGQGEPALVFVHGWSCDRGYWSSQMEHFGKTHRVVAIDLAGHGASGLNRTDWTIPAFGEDVAAVVNKLGLTKVVLIGHSMGGPVCLEAARRLPDKVIALVGADTYQDFGRTYTEADIAPLVAGFEQDFQTTANAFVRTMFPQTADSAMVVDVASDMASAPPEIAVSAFRHVVTYDAGPALKEVKVPIRGINSDMVPVNVEGNQALAESFEVKMMPGIGHFVMCEDPAMFNAKLEEVLSELTAAAH